MAHFLASHALRLFLVLCMFLNATACQARTRRPSRYLIPEGHVGWVRIDFKIKDAPALFIEDGYYLFKIPPSGQLKTSSDIEYGVATDEFYYYSDNNRRRLESTGWGGGGTIWGSFNGSAQGEESAYQYFFVGSEEEFKKYGDRDKGANFHPKVGPANSNSPTNESIKSQSDNRP